MRIGCVAGKPVLVHDAGVFDLSVLAPTVQQLVATWPGARSVEREALSSLELGGRALDAPVPRPGKIVGVPVNYRDHAREMDVSMTMADLGIFLKAPTSVIGPGGTVQLPYTDRRTDQEGELAVVMGRRCRHLSPDEGLTAVFGYTCLLDITVRGQEDRSTRKSFDTFTPLGPWIVTADEIPDPDDLALRCWVNDELRQDACTAGLFFGVGEVIAYASSVMTLEPGDVIATGTPAGVGPLADGDRVAVEIDRIGRLEVRVSARHAVPWGQRRPCGS